MAKYKVLKSFRDIHTNEIYETNSEIELSKKRVNEIEKNLDGSFLMRIDQDEKQGME